MKNNRKPEAGDIWITEDGVYIYVICERQDEPERFDVLVKADNEVWSTDMDFFTDLYTYAGKSVVVFNDLFKIKEKSDED